MTHSMLRKIRRGLIWSGQDLAWGLRSWGVNRLAGHDLMPRLGRHLVYRALGLDVRALDVASGVRITGGAGLTIGAHCYLNHGVYLEAAGGITVGERCAIGPEVMVLSTAHPVGRGGWQDDLVRTPTVIGDRVWIAARAVILPGSTLPAGSVVAAGAIVSGQFTEPGVYAGNPARFIGPIRGQTRADA